MPNVNLPVEEHQLNDFFIGTMKHISKKDPADVITPRNPLFKRLEANGNIETRPPTHTYTEDVTFVLPDKSITISKDSDMKERDYTPVDVSTQAKYNPILRIDTLTIPMFEYENNKGASQLVDIVVRKKKQADKAIRNALAGVLWNGASEGSTHVFGIKEAVQFVTSANPTAGKVGDIDQTVFTWWKNKARNYNKAYATVSSGLYDPSSFLESDDNSLLQLWMDCTELEGGDTETGSPDLFVCNDVLYKYMSSLVNMKLIFNDTMNKRDLGIGESIYYRGMDVFYDRNVPDDPNNSAYGVGFMLNTNSFAWTYSEGLKGESWGDMQKLSKTGFAWDRKVQFTTTWRNRAQNGVIFGVKNVGVS